LEEMIPAPAEVKGNIKDVVESAIVYPSEKFQICPSFF